MSDDARNDGYKVCPLEDLPEGDHVVVSVNGREIGVFHIDGSIYALPNRCIHQGGPLCEGRLSGTLVAGADTDWRPEWRYEGEVLACPWHSMEFHVPSGRCFALPEVRLRHYPTEVRDGVIYLMI